MTLSLGSLPLPLSVMAKVADSHTWTSIMADIRIRFEFHAKISVMALTPSLSPLSVIMTLIFKK